MKTIPITLFLACLMLQVLVHPPVCTALTEDTGSGWNLAYTADRSGITRHTPGIWIFEEEDLPEADKRKTEIQRKDALQWVVKAGAHIPAGDYGEVVEDTGFLFGGEIKKPLGDFWSLGLHLSYSEAIGEGKEVYEWGDYYNGFYITDYDVLYYDVHVTMIECYPFFDFHILRGERLGAFFRGGLGVNHTMVKVESDWGNDSEKFDETDVMFAFGAGLNFWKHFEVLALYNDTPDLIYYTLSVGINFSFG